MMTGAPLGEVIYSAVKPMIRMYMIIGTGFFITKKGLFGVTAARACSDMVLMLFMPALIFDKVVSYIDISDIKTIGVICFCAFIMYSINACVAFLIVKFTPIPKTPKDRWVGGAMLAGIMQNVSDLPIAYIQAISIFSLSQQNKGTAYVIIWLAMYVVAQFNCGLFQLVDWDFKYTEENYYNKMKSDDASQIDLENNHVDNEKDNENNLHKKLTPPQEDSQEESQEHIEHHDSTGTKSVPENDSISDDLDSISSASVHQDINNAPHVYLSPTRQSYSTESPLSETSSIDSEVDSVNLSASHNAQSINSRSSNINPRPLTLITSRLSQISRAASRTTAIARIPSARSVNFDHADTDDLMSLNQELIREYSRAERYNQNMSKAMRIVTETNLTMKDVHESGDKVSFVNKYHLHFLVFFLQNFKKPNSIVLIFSLAMALIPWTKALFVSTGSRTLPNAPDEQPPLSFVIMYAEYLGTPCVPLGLILVGSVLARLELKGMPKGFWKSAVCNTVFRLGILPIIGTAFISRLKRIGWLTDPMALFVCTMEFALPSATVQIYLTAGAMRPDDKTCTPMNCIGLYLILQYMVLVISMPIVVCYCIKNVIDM